MILVYCIFTCSVAWTLPGRLHDLGVVSHGNYQEGLIMILVYCIFACSVAWTLPGRLHDLGVLYLCL